MAPPSGVSGQQRLQRQFKQLAVKARSERKNSQLNAVGVMEEEAGGSVPPAASCAGR